MKILGLIFFALFLATCCVLVFAQEGHNHNHDHHNHDHHHHDHHHQHDVHSHGHHHHGQQTSDVEPKDEETKVKILTESDFDTFISSQKTFVKLYVQGNRSPSSKKKKIDFDFFF